MSWNINNPDDDVDEDVVLEKGDTEVARFTPDGTLKNSSTVTEHAGNVTLASAYDDLQTAVNESKENIVFVDGEFAVSPPLTLPPGTTLLGGTRYWKPTVSDQKGSYIRADDTATDTDQSLVVVDGENSGDPANTSIKGVALDGRPGVNEVIRVEQAAHSVRFRDLNVYFGKYSFNIRGAGVDIDNCELNNAQNASVTFTHENVRGVTIRNSYFEGLTAGIVETYSDIPYHGYIHFLNNRFAYYGISDDNGFDLQISPDVKENFSVLVKNNQFFEPDESKNLDYYMRILGDTSGVFGGPITITDNEFIGRDRDTGNRAVTRAIQVYDSCNSELTVTQNRTRGFINPSANQPLNVKNAKDSLTIGGNRGETQFENGSKATFSGDGSTTVFTIDHGIQYAPSRIDVTPDLSTDATTIDGYQNVTSSSFDVVFSSAPASGTDNVEVSWDAAYV